MEFSKDTLGLLVGGILPAFLFGLVGVLQKIAGRLGIGLGFYLLGIGLGVCFTGAVVYFWHPDRTLSAQAGIYSILIGLLWSAGMCLVAIGLTRYGAAIAKLAPLYNMNTLIAVLVGLWLFAEWQEANIGRLLAGTVLIMLGGALVAKS